MTQVVSAFQSADACKTVDAESGPGEQAARRVLLEDHRNVLSYLVRELSDTEEAREVWQCFALRALSRSSGLRDPQAVHLWMSRVLASTIADHRRGLSRTRRREVPIDGIDADDGVFTSEAASPENEAPCECIHDVLRSLRPDYAEIVRRADLLSEPREEIAVSLNTTVNNIGVRLHRGRAALRRGLEHACGGCVDQTVFQCGCPEMDSSVNGSGAKRQLAEAEMKVEPGRRGTEAPRRDCVLPFEPNRSVTGQDDGKIIEAGTCKNWPATASY